MLARRTVLLAPLALCAQTPRPRVNVVWLGPGPTLPAAFAEQAVVFPRAYANCPDVGPDGENIARRVLETGRYPHAFRDGPGLADFFDAGDGITIMTARSFDGGESPFDRSVRVPLAIRWPGRLAPRVAHETLISHVDLLPTLLALAGIPAPAGLQGRDLSLLVEGRGGPVPEAIYAEGSRRFVGEWRLLIRGFDKIIWDLKEQVTGLYNLADDSEEETDLKDQSEHRLTRDSMMALAREWMRRVEDGMNPAGLRIRR